MPYGRPADTDPDAWYRAAWRIDQACLANEAFQSVSRFTPSGLTKTVSARPPPMSVVRLPPAPPLPVTPKPAPPTPSMGVPMDVDATRKARSLPLRGCYRCGDANHLVRDCPHCMDVRQLTSEQQKKLFEDLLALKDAVLIEESSPPGGRRGFCIARPAISAPRSLVNKFTVLTIEDPNTIDSELTDAPPPNPPVPAPLRKPK